MSRFTELVGVERPLQQAAMSRVATPQLVAAVSAAGALGMAPIGRSGVEQALGFLDRVEALTNRPYGAGFVVPMVDRTVADAVIERVSIIEFAFGWPTAALVPDGRVVGWMVGTVDEARAAVDVGCSNVIAQGVEAGGHVRDTVPLAELLPAVRNAVDVPIVAAGGLGSRADVDRAFGLGADAARIGTRFLAAAETDVHPRYLELLLRASDADTMWTDAFSVGWPGPLVPVRVLASAQAAADATDLDPLGDQGGRPMPRFGATPPTSATTGYVDAMALYAGTSVGAVAEVTTAAAIIDELV